MGERPSHVAATPYLAVAGSDRASPVDSYSFPASQAAQIPQVSCVPRVKATDGQHPPISNEVLNAVETHGALLPYPPRAIVPVQSLDLYHESDPINQYVASDPRFRDSTLVFPRIRPNSSWPFWNRHRVKILTALASAVALGFVLVAIIGSITIKEK